MAELRNAPELAAADIDGTELLPVAEAAPGSGLKKLLLSTVKTFVLDGFEGGGGGDFPEAPIDGKTYGRKDGAWAEVVAGEGGGGSSDKNYEELSPVLINGWGVLPGYGAPKAIKVGRIVALTGIVNQGQSGSVGIALPSNWSPETRYYSSATSADGNDVALGQIVIETTGEVKLYPAVEGSYVGINAIWIVAEENAAPGGGGSGGGGSTRKRPTVVQKATIRNDGRIELPNQPKIGNKLYFFAAGYGASDTSYPPAGFARAGRHISNNNNSVTLDILPVITSSTPKGFDVTAGDNQQAVLYEIADSEWAYPGGGGAITYNGNNIFDLVNAPCPYADNALVLLGMENDNTTRFAMPVQNKVIEDFSTPNDGLNHTGWLGRVDRPGDPLIVKGAVNGPAQDAVFGFFWVLGLFGPAQAAIAATGWRVRVLEYQGDSYWGMSELQFVNAAGEQLAVGGTPLSGSKYDEQRGPQKAFDGNLQQNDQNGFLGRDKNVNDYVGYEFAAAVTVTEIRLFPLQNTQQAPKLVQVDYRVDANSPWTPIGDPIDLVAKGLVYNSATLIPVQ